MRGCQIQVVVEPARPWPANGKTPTDNTGEGYTVDAGHKHYWVNSNGEYIATDNPMYDPRIDNRINDTQWSRFENEG